MCVTASFAAGPRCGRYYVDANGDGFCNNAGSQCAYVDSDGDGICDNYQSGQGHRVVSVYVTATPLTLASSAPVSAGAVDCPCRITIFRFHDCPL